jgi:hypothetical protein
MFWLLLATLPLAAADGPCGAALCPPAADIDAVLKVPPGAGALPAGRLDGAQLEAAFLEVQRGGGGLKSLFALLADGVARELPGDVVRGLMQKYGVSMDILPIDKLDRIVSDGRSVEFRFDFKGQQEVTVPGGAAYAVKRSDPSPTYSADSKLKTIKSDASKLRIKSRVKFTISEDGITGLREGDIQADGGWLAGWVNIGLHMETHPGKYAMEGDRPLVKVGEDGRPEVVNGRYVSQRYDNWMVITGPLGYRKEIGIPSW